MSQPTSNNPVEKKDLTSNKPVVDKYANTTAIGIFASAFTTMMFNVRNIGWTEMSLAIAAVAFCVGGIVQLVGGIFELKRGNTFYGTRFVVMSGFWMSLVFLWGLFPGMGGIFGEGNISPDHYPYSTINDGSAMGVYFLLWSLIVAVFFVCSFKFSVVTRIAMGAIAVLLFLLSIHFFTGVLGVRIAAGIFGIIGAGVGFYAAAGILINHEFKRNILPLGYKPKKLDDE
ncbi:MAG: acetate uptake transporter [Firmicutes bacterium]|nr:acetate uptake transporter [Bacillota bacterium]